MSDMNQKLKPCPFCNGKVIINFTIELEPVGGVWCTRCHMLAKFTGIKPVGKNEKFGRYIDDLTELWNRRAKDIEEDE